MKFTKIYWDQLKKNDVFRIRKYDSTVTEELLVVNNLPRKWKVTFENFVGDDTKNTLCYLDMNGFCERLQ